MITTEVTPAPRSINPTDPGSAAWMHHATPSRKHPAEVVLGALLRGRSVDLPGGRTYRLDDDLTLGTVGIGTDKEHGEVVVARDLRASEFLRLSEALSFNDLYLIGCDRVLAEVAVERRRERARLVTAAQAA